MTKPSSGCLVRKSRAPGAHKMLARLRIKPFSFPRTEQPRSRHPAFASHITYWYLMTRNERISLSDTNHSCTVLADETAVYFEDTKRRLVDLTGARHVVLKSTGFASMGTTVVLAVTALTPLVICRGVQQVSKFQKTGSVYVMFQEPAWLRSAVLGEWIDIIFPAALDHGTGSARSGTPCKPTPPRKHAN